jgi:hypothetical protein
MILEIFYQCNTVIKIMIIILIIIIIVMFFLLHRCLPEPVK